MRLYITPDPGNVNCSSCGKYNVQGCTRCHKCDSCCVCRHCRDCSRVHPIHPCPTCAMCRSLCTCRNRPAVLVFPRHFTPTALGELKRLRTSDSLQRPLGVEVEILNYSGRRPPDGRWGEVPVRWMTDGTIRGADGERAPKGIECIVGPMFGRLTGQGMNSLGDWLRSVHASVNASCGLHVHVGVQDLTAEQIACVIKTYHLLEPVFYSLVQPTRATTRYGGVFTPQEWKAILNAVRNPLRNLRSLAGVVYGIPAILRGKQYGAALRRSRMEKRVPLRYRGFNLPGIFHQGTLEFRMHEGCVQIERIRQWALWCGWFVEVASRLTRDEVRRLKTPEDFYLGQWPRKGGVLAIPKDTALFVQSGRDAEPYRPAAVAPVVEDSPSPMTLNLRAMATAQAQQAAASPARLRFRASNPAQDPGRAEVPGPGPGFTYQPGPILSQATTDYLNSILSDENFINSLNEEEEERDDL